MGTIWAIDYDMGQWVWSGNIIIGGMQRQKMAEMVLARMREKREEEERNRPQLEVLRLEVVFSIEKGTLLRERISALQQRLRLQTQTLQRLQLFGQELDSTGKKAFPRLILLPQFIAAESIQAKYKDFYRKAGNSFLRYEIIRSKEHERAVEWEREVLQGMGKEEELGKKVGVADEQEVRNVNKRRLAVLKQELYLRRLKREQQTQRSQIASQQQANRTVQNEYATKRSLVQSSSIRMSQLQQDISRYRSMIETRFNPETYRQFVGGVFTLRMKNQALRRSFSIVREELVSIKRQHHAIQGEGNKNRMSHSRMNRVVKGKRGSTFDYEEIYTSIKNKPQRRRLKTEQISTKITPVHTEPSERLTTVPSPHGHIHTHA